MYITCKESQEGTQGATGVKLKAPSAMSDTETVVLYVLQHASEGSRVSMREIRAQYGMGNISSRAIRRVVVSLITNHGIAIGSSSSKTDGGYFLIKTKEQRGIARREILSRIKKQAAKLAAIDDITLDAVYGQLALIERGK